MFVALNIVRWYEEDKAKLIVRWGRKATGLKAFKIAGLP